MGGGSLSKAVLDGPAVGVEALFERPGEGGLGARE